MTAVDALRILADIQRYPQMPLRWKAFTVLFQAVCKRLHYDGANITAQVPEEVECLHISLMFWLDNGFDLCQELVTDDHAIAYLMTAIRNRIKDHQRSLRHVPLPDDSKSALEVHARSNQADEAHGGLQAKGAGIPEEFLGQDGRLSHVLSRLQQDLERAKQRLVTLMEEERRRFGDMETWARAGQGGFGGEVFRAMQEHLEPRVAPLMELLTEPKYWDLPDGGPQAGWETLIQSVKAYGCVLRNCMDDVIQPDRMELFVATYRLLVDIRLDRTTVTKRAEEELAHEGRTREDQDFTKMRNRLYRRVCDFLKRLEESRKQLEAAVRQAGPRPGGPTLKGLLTARKWIEDLRVYQRSPRIDGERSDPAKTSVS